MKCIELRVQDPCKCDLFFCILFTNLSGTRFVAHVGRCNYLSNLVLSGLTVNELSFLVLSMAQFAETVYS